MTRKSIITVAGGALATALLAVGPAAAQGYGHGHGGHQVHRPHHAGHVCYEKVTTPDVYGFVKKRVLVKEGVWESKDIAAVTKIIDRKVEVEPGRWEVKSTPAVIETREKQVLVSPEHTIWHVTPPVYKTERVAKPVHTGGHGHGGGYGHKKENAVLSYDRQVLVEPAKRHAEVKPAVYKTVKFQVVVEHAKHQKIWHPPVYETKQEEVVIAPAHQTKVFHAPVYDWKQEKVLVKHGHTFARPVHKAYGEKC